MQSNPRTLKPLFKVGVLDDPDNYRGIYVSSCFARLYSAVLNERFINAIDKFNLISREQIGFLKGFRTTDHSFVINSLVNKLVKEGNKTTYAALVDLRKAYDRINRNFLIYKMQRRSIPGKFLATVQAMLQNVKRILKIVHILLPSILTYTGLKQGDNLSPLEFNLFFDDLKDIFDSKCDPVQLFSDITISHLLFTDDMIMLSTSVSGMQRCFDNLKVYCKKWQLEMSIK